MAQAAEPAAKAQGGTTKAPAKASGKPATKPVAKPASKSKPRAKPVSKAVAQPLPKARLDLSLPSDMVRELKPQVGGAAPAARKPLLPAMFSDKPEADDSPFQLNGRLISNEMQLQLRNDSRKEVEGAAIEFQFRN